jgi:hypothetical protein
LTQAQAQAQVLTQLLTQLQVQQVLLVSYQKGF